MVHTVPPRRIRSARAVLAALALGVSLAGSERAEAAQSTGLPTVEFTAASQSGAESVPSLVLTLQLSETSPVDVTVPFTVSGTATAGADFTLDASPAVIPAGQLTRDLVLAPVNDALDEAAETVIVTLGTPTNATLGTVVVHTATLTDDDPTPSVAFTVTRQRRREGAGSFDVNIALSTVSGRDVVVRFATSGNATAGVDYTISASPVVIPQGQAGIAIGVQIIDDTLRENAEEIWITITNAVGATVGTPATHGITLLENDGPAGEPIVGELAADPPALGFDAVRVGTSPSQTLPLTLINDEDLPITFNGATPIGANAGEFSVQYPVPPPVVLQPGESVPIEVAFAPSGIGLRQAKLRIQQTPHGVQLAQVPVSGVAFGPTGAELTINVGTVGYVDGGGQGWVPDFHVLGSSILAKIQGPIGGTTDDPLYHDLRKGNAFGYALDLPSGRYEVELHFVEPDLHSKDLRVFDVLLEGTIVEDDLDVFEAAGYRNAWVVRHEVDVLDGVLELGLDGEVGNAVLAAFAIRSVPIVTPDPDEIDFGLVDSGTAVDVPFTLTNTGLHDAHATQLSFVIPSYEPQAGHDFSVLIEGVRYYGDHQTVSHPIDLDIPAGESVDLIATYLPTEHQPNTLWLRFDGNFQSAQIDLAGSGSGGDDWGFLHPVIDTVPVLIVDYDQNGRESVTLDASDSHTHEPGRSIVSWNWFLNGQLIATTQQHTRNFVVGSTQVDLTIGDDSQPPKTATEHGHVDVHPIDAVPGILTYYYDATGIGSSALLDAVPSQASFAERISDLLVPPGPTVGGSSFTQDVMVRLLGSFEVQQNATYTFTATGGVGTRLFVDGFPYAGGDLPLAPGSYSLEARFAVDTLADLPLAVAVTIDGQASEGFGGLLVHDETPVDPLIHAMPSVGNESGGNLIVIQGFGFFPKNGVIVHWGTDVGSPDITSSSFLSWTDEQIEFLSPPSPGPPGQATPITVVVQTPNGFSNARTYTYSPDGDVPIVFDQLASVFVGNATTGDWGPDGRFYVGLLSGHIKAITFDASYNATLVQTYPGVSMLPNKDVLGIAFNPYDPPGVVKIYVAHGELYAQGGGAFSGPSPYTGQVSVLTGPTFDSPQPLITRLPTSNHDHGVNGMQFDDNGDLLIAVGGNTNAGVKHPHIGDLPESPLSAAILKAELSRPDFDGDLRYVETQTGFENDDQVFGEIVEVAPGTHVEVHAPGLRNPFDLVYTTWRMLYCTDNGPNAGFGRTSTGPDTDEADANTVNDEIVLVEYDNYYGHPNRSRGRFDPRQNVYRGETAAAIPGEFVQMIASAPSSTDGIVEYRAAAFNSQMRGELLVQKYGEKWRRIELTPDRRRAVTTLPMATVPALDLQTGPGGAVLPIDYGGYVKVLVPNDQAAVGLTVYDITPWRAPVTGGHRFVIGGHGFGTLQNTTVTIGGVPATLVSVSPKRIVGTIPAGISPTMQLVDVVVSVGLDVDTLPAAFQALPATPGLAPGYWTSGTPIPEPLGEVAGGIIGRNLYLVGEGVSSNTKTFTYDLVNEFWTSTAAQRPFAGHHHAAEVVNGKLYLIGGLGGGSEGKVQVFDPNQGSNGTWTLGANMPWNGGSVASALIGGKIYVAGGIVGSGTVAHCAVYDPVANSWTSLAPMPTGVNHAASATDGQKMWVFGGRQGGNTPQPGFTNVQVYDPAANTWDDSGQPGSTLADMPSGRGGTGRAVFYRRKFFVMGGETNDPNDSEATPNRVFPQVFVYDPVANAWRQDARMPTARHGIFPLLFQSRIHVIAGGTTFGHSSSSVHEIFTRQ